MDWSPVTYQHHGRLLVLMDASFLVLEVFCTQSILLPHLLLIVGCLRSFIAFDLTGARLKN